MAARQGIFDGILTKLGIFDRAEDPAGIFGEDYVPAPTTTSTMVDEEEWWGGAQLCFAQIAIGTALGLSLSMAAGASELQQQNEEITVPAKPEEDFWVNSVAPVPSTQTWPQQWAYDTQDPAGSLYGQPDEDFWQNPVSPIQLVQSWPQQWVFDVQEPAGSLRGQPDEDFWVNPVAPVVATVAWPQQWTFDTQEPAGSLRGQPDEDFWQNPVAPVPLIQTWPQQFAFDVQEPAGSLYGVPEEEPWQLRPTFSAPATYRVFSDTDEVVSAVVAFTPDEDFWVGSVPPWLQGTSLQAIALLLSSDHGEDTVPAPAVIYYFTVIN